MYFYAAEMRDQAEEGQEVKPNTMDQDIWDELNNMDETEDFLGLSAKPAAEPAPKPRSRLVARAFGALQAAEKTAHEKTVEDDDFGRPCIVDHLGSWEFPEGHFDGQEVQPVVTLEDDLVSVKRSTGHLEEGDLGGKSAQPVATMEVDLPSIEGSTGQLAVEEEGHFDGQDAQPVATLEYEPLFFEHEAVAAEPAGPPLAQAAAAEPAGPPLQRLPILARSEDELAAMGAALLALVQQSQAKIQAEALATAAQNSNVPHAGAAGASLARSRRHRSASRAPACKVWAPDVRRARTPAARAEAPVLPPRRPAGRMPSRTGRSNPLLRGRTCHVASSSA